MTYRKVKATSLVTAGCLSLEDLHKPEYISELTNHQRIGLRYLYDIEARVSREEAEKVAEFVRNNIGGEGYEVILGGSYRRGRPTSGDIDLILIHPDSDPTIPIQKPPPPSPPGSLKPSPPKAKAAKTKAEELAESKLVKEVVKPLEDLGVLAATLSSGLSKWQGMVLVPDRNREGVWQDKGERLSLIQTKNADEEGALGCFRRMDLK